LTAPHEPARGVSPDLEVFAATLFGLASALFLGGPLFVLAGAAEGQATSLFTSIASASALPALWFAFIIVPALAAFLLIGLPSLVRGLAVPGRRVPGSLLAVLAMSGTAAVALLGSKLSAAWGALGLALLMAVALGVCRSLVRLRGPVIVRWSLVAGALSLVVVAGYEFPVAAGRAPSIALAPTFMVLAAFLLETGLVVLLAHTLATRRQAATCLLCTATAIVWYLAVLTGVLSQFPDLPFLEAALTLTTGLGLAALAFYGLRTSDISGRP